MTPLAVVVAVALCAAPGARAAQPAANAWSSISWRPTLEGVLAFVPESTPPATGFTLYEVAWPGLAPPGGRRGRGGFRARRGRAGGCAAASSSSSRPGQARVLLDDVLPELASILRAYLARGAASGATGSAIDLFDRQESRVCGDSWPGRAPTNAPLFAPDGSLIFVSTRTGLSSF